MLALRELTAAKASTPAGIARPLCPNCGRQMHLNRISNGSGGRPDLHTFGCGECGVWVTEASDDRV